MIRQGMPTTQLLSRRPWMLQRRTLPAPRAPCRSSVTPLLPSTTVTIYKSDIRLLLSPTRITMADIFISYAGADREIVGCIVALLEAQGWSVWWDTRIDAGERSDEIIEREIATARCVVVVWTQQSIDREWVHEEADRGANAVSLCRS